MNFIEYLKDKGFEAKRYCKVNGKFMLLSGKEAGISDDTFSTMVSGGLDIRLIKGDKFVVWGLGDYGKPPTLLRPLPISDVEISEDGKRMYFGGNMQDKTERWMKEHTHDELFKALGL